MIKHVALILDGNRRLAKELLKRPWEGHKMGVKTALNALQWACEYGIKYITAYVLSLENLATRPKRELGYIMKYLGEECDAVLSDRGHPVHRLKVKVNFIGRTHVLPDWLQAKLKAVEKATARYSKHVMNCAVAYGGQQEITDAVREIVGKIMKGPISAAKLGTSITDKLISQNLYTAGQPFPDLIIRTGGDRRLSNFLPYQSAYSELVFIDKRWPEMQREDFLQAFEDFESRQRRFGR
jgi:tritrans,polycis-undecaprenyl-diphosphate synthase [geranylgeranyl-diphosphate specific]